MTPALVVWAVVATILAAGLASYAHTSAQAHAREIASMHTTLDRHDRWSEREINYWRVEADQERERSRETFRMLGEQHGQQMREVYDRHAGEIERLTNLLTVGTPARPEAIVTPQEPDAESRVLKQISEDSIKAGCIRLKQEYEAIGIMVAEEELRDEVIAMLMGTEIKTDPNRILKVVD